MKSLGGMDGGPGNSGKVWLHCGTQVTECSAVTFGECRCPSGTVLFLSCTEVCASVCLSLRGILLIQTVFQIMTVWH